MVDQSPRTLWAMERLLRGEGHTVCTTTDAAQAKRLAAHCAFDLLITDLGCPGRPEPELLRDLRALARANGGLRGIAVTAIDPRHLGGKAFLLRDGGYEAVLVKPIQFSGLLEAIQQLAFA